mmetsp:Transcript_9224/g.10513  ORF Transcript_9224/g.10513 Transcript_9224/m.10513 type:complete len:80 (-) Transcript_9224:799-1038(-)
MKVNNKCHNQIVSPISLTVEDQIRIGAVLRMTDGSRVAVVDRGLSRESLVSSFFRFYGYHDKIQCFVFLLNVIQKRKQY